MKSILKSAYRTIILPIRENLRLVILYLYYSIRASRPVLRLIDSKGIKLYTANQPKLNEAQRRIADDLKKNGVAFTHIDELFPEENLLPKLQEYTASKLKSAQTGRKKKFLKYAWNQDKQPADFGNPLFLLAINPKALAIAASYLETYPKFKFFSANLTLPVPPGTEAAGSQRWHRDPGITKICKMFLYLNDVGEEAGPFTYALGSHREGKYGKLFPQKAFGRIGVYPPEGAVENKIPNEEIKLATGKAGTIIFCDTTGIHKGGYATSKERVMFTALYEPKSAIGKAKFSYPDNFEARLANLEPISKYSLENSYPVVSGISKSVSGFLEHNFFLSKIAG